MRFVERAQAFGLDLVDASFVSAFCDYDLDGDPDTSERLKKVQAELDEEQNRHVANLLARRELSRLAIGERIRVDGVEGDIVDIYNTGLDIATEDGITSIPAARARSTWACISTCTAPGSPCSPASSELR